MSQMRIKTNTYKDKIFIGLCLGFFHPFKTYRELVWLRQYQVNLDEDFFEQTCSFNLFYVN